MVDRCGWVAREPKTFTASNGSVLERSDDCVACGEVWRWSGLNADRLCLPCYRAEIREDLTDD